MNLLVFDSHLIYQSFRKSESIAFPSERPITTTTLVQFILKHSQTSVRLQTSLQLCNRRCLLNNLRFSQSHRRSIRRNLGNRLRELSLVRQTIRQKSAKRKSQLKELKDHSNYLIKSIRKLRQILIKISLLRALIVEKVNNFNSSAQTLSSESIKQFSAIFSTNSNDSKPRVVAKQKELTKKDIKIKDIKTSTKTTKKMSKYSKGESNPKRDEL